MIVYADASVLIALFHPADTFSKNVNRWFERNEINFVWNPILRNEVRHNLRKLKSTYARTAWNAFRAAEKTGRLAIGRDRLNILLEDADDLSAQKAGSVPAGTWDFFHVAAGLHAKAACFATCDEVQASLAESTEGFNEVKLFIPQ